MNRVDLRLVRDYHHTYYAPHNFTLIVAGKLAAGTKSLLDVVQQKVEPIIIQHGQNHGPRPKGWRADPMPLVEQDSHHRARGCIVISGY